MSRFNKRPPVIKTPHMDLSFPTAQQMDVRFKVSQLTHATTMRLLHKRKHIAGRMIKLDLTSVKSADPFGLVFLYSYIFTMLELEASRIHVEVPRDSLGGALEASGLGELLSGDSRITLSGTGILGRFLRNRVRPHLIEIRRYSVHDEDEADALALRLLDMLVVGKDQRMRGLSELLQTALTEVISNVAVHSGQDQVVVTASRTGDHVVMAIGDRGIGIPVRLRKSNIAVRLDDAHAIDKALEAGISTRVGRGGLGLTTVAEQVRDHGTHMVIRSGEGQVAVSQKGTEKRNGCIPLPGTIIEVGW